VVSGTEGRASSRAAVRLVIAAGAAALLALAVLAVRSDVVDPAELRDFVLSFGRLAPAMWAALYVVAVFVPYATTLMTIGAGLAFGALWGTLLTWCVTIFASLLPFTVARRLGRAWVEARIGNTRVKKYADLINANAFLVVFYLRLIPSLPYELQNPIAGITRITYGRFMAASALGIGPILFILAFLGDSLSDPGSSEFRIAAGIYAVALLSPLGIAVVRRLRGRRGVRAPGAGRG
jgi:uncharacterized membrane protein YdjX (TVP38/TMEM64 family)